LTVDPVHELPPELVERAQEFVASGQQPVATEDAATVVLLRPATLGFEAYLLRRHSRMAFAAGMYAFPGGRVDPRDYDADVGWGGRSAGEWAESFGCSPDLARALVCAAVRETFEEAGVLLAGRTFGAVVSVLGREDWEADRKALMQRTLSLAKFLDSRRLVVRSDLLRPWAHWITPEFEPRRYDTRFFLAALPAGQEARDVSGEADAVAWMRPEEAVAAVDRREMAMLPPTYVTLRELAEFDTVDDALAAADRRTVTRAAAHDVDDDAAPPVPGDLL
jgi:8-oxo-dGTP pyrophosphatase MutT (NUDIX family)